MSRAIIRGGLRDPVEEAALIDQKASLRIA
jgi:hypothetical protein